MDNQSVAAEKRKMLIATIAVVALVAVLIIIGVLTPSDNKRYDLVFIDGKDYLQLRDFEYYDYTQGGTICVTFSESTYTAYFSSVAEAQDAYYNDKFSDENFRALKMMANRAGLVRIPDLPSLRNPQFPDGLQIENVGIKWDTCSIFFNSNGMYDQIQFCAKSQEDHQSSLEFYQQIKADDEKAALRTQTDKDRNADIYIRNGFDGVVEDKYYVLTSLDKSLYVHEHYSYDKSRQKLKWSFITVYGQTDNGCYYLEIEGQNKSPDTEWLLQFAP